MAKEAASQQLRAEIRKLTQEVRLLQRDLWQNPAVVVAPEKTGKRGKAQSKSAEVKPAEEAIEESPEAKEAREAKQALLTKQDEEKRRLELKYDQGFGKPYEPLDEHKVADFCELYYGEIDRKDRRNVHYLQRLYDPQATQLIVGVGSLKGREEIATSILRKFEGICCKHEVRNIELESIPGSPVLSAKLTLAVSIDGDKPRKVMQMFEWCKSKEPAAFDFVIIREVLVVQDARPLYHFSEFPAPVSRSPHVLATVGPRDATARSEGEGHSDDAGSDSGSEGKEEGEEEDEDQEGEEDEDEDDGDGNGEGDEDGEEENNENEEDAEG